MRKTLIIAEAGVNHNGSLEMAKQMVDVAKDCDVDFVKFQTLKVTSLVSRLAKTAEYQKQNMGMEESQMEMLQRITLSYDDFAVLKEYCKSKNIGFLSTPFDIDSVHFLNDMVPFWKIPSGEITNYPYLVEIAKTGKKVVLSTGMSDLQDIEAAVSVLKQFGTPDIVLLHCNTQYPTPYEDVNLRAMNTLKEHFNVPVGYSDHTNGIEVPIAAVAMGATIIEKHFTLDRNLPGPDHKASIEPGELRQMVTSIRNIEAAMGDGIKVVTKSEKENIAVARKSIVAAINIKKGEVFTSQNITTKRPGNGISPMMWNDVIGRKAVRDFCEDELIEL